jgi:dephospho-CoA kinase
MQISDEESIGLVGLTGGIATGKSTVSAMFQQLGVDVIDADKLAREVVERGRVAYEDIVETFGARVVGDDGSIDREQLGAIVFDDREAKERLEKITHPRIAEQMRRRVVELAKQGVTWCIYDAALLVETGSHEWMDVVIVVTAGRETQIDRLASRDGLQRSEAIDRIESQTDDETRSAIADYTIDNDGSLEQTRRQVEQLCEDLNRRFG